jgi:hypothetical protein
MKKWAIRLGVGLVCTGVAFSGKESETERFEKLINCINGCEVKRLKARQPMCSDAAADGEGMQAFRGRWLQQPPPSCCVSPQDSPRCHG